VCGRRRTASRSLRVSVSAGLAGAFLCRFSALDPHACGLGGWVSTMVRVALRHPPPTRPLSRPLAYTSVACELVSLSNGNGSACVCFWRRPTKRFPVLCGGAGPAPRFRICKLSPTTALRSMGIGAIGQERWRDDRAKWLGHCSQRLGQRPAKGCQRQRRRSQIFAICSLTKPLLP